MVAVRWVKEVLQGSILEGRGVDLDGLSLVLDLSAVDVEIVAGYDVCISIRALSDACSVVGSVDECRCILCVGAI